MKTVGPSRDRIEAAAPAEHLSSILKIVSSLRLLAIPLATLLIR
jgi:hypothetical protein